MHEAALAVKPSFKMGSELIMADEPQDDKPKAKSRYEQVKEILNTAQGSSNPSYQGHGRFWNLPLEEFLQVKLYGIPMIASAGEEDFCQDYMTTTSASGHSCCESEPEGDEEAPTESSSQPESESDEGASNHSCCGPSASAAASGMKPARGAASGWIRGLKGEFPFDGTQFPPLPWGCQQVSGSEIL